jgi:hypothetical protein
MLAAAPPRTSLRTASPPKPVAGELPKLGVWSLIQPRTEPDSTLVQLTSAE